MVRRASRGPAGARRRGAAAGALAEACARRGVRRTLTALVSGELALLGAFMVLGLRASTGSGLHPATHWQLDALAALPALALGIQTAALRRVAGQTTRTVFVTGMLTRFAEEAVRCAFWSHDRRQGVSEHPWRNEPSRRRLVVIGGVVVAYAGGALLGARLDADWHLWALALPLGALGAVVAADAAAPARPGPL